LSLYKATMEHSFKTRNPESLDDNFFRRINRDWMLITAGTLEHFNTMTASWGTMGILWNKPVAICFIRPHRYTFQFAEKHDFFTLTFLEDTYRDILSFCGSHSGKDTDKIAGTGLVPLELGRESISFEQAQLIFECRKMYADYIKEDNFFTRELIRKNYPGRDFHRFYIGEIVNCYCRGQGKSEK
jgi:flavin reductase (DIM6/NTAB) family NADH-FMN oxidoreductase RutF